MKIRSRLTLLFSSLVAVILLATSIVIYYVHSENRRVDFDKALTTKGANTARFILSNNAIDTAALHSLSRRLEGKLVEEKIVLYSIDFNKLYESEGNSDLVITTAFFNKVKDNGNASFKKGDLEGVGVRLTEDGKDYVVIASGVDTVGKAQLNSLLHLLLGVYICCLLLTLLTSSYLAGRAMAPLSKMIRNMEGIDYSSLSTRIDEGNGRDEMAQLAQTFNNMLDRLNTTFKVQKDFVANASHELRTPLTSITGTLEVLMMKARSNEEYKQALESVLEDIKNLSLTSNRLLMLAQASSKMTEFSFSPTRIDEVLWQAQAEVLKRKPEYQVEINFYDLPEDEMQLTIMGNDQLLKTMVTNLMDNGCKYSSDMTVKVQLSVYHNLVQIIFSDQGIGISKEDQPHIFEPFYRSTNAITMKGHGLGLSLVSRIVNLHNGKIKVLSETGVGSAFIITFPLAQVQNVT